MTENTIEDIYELTPMQHGMLFHSLLDPSSGMYVEQMSCDVKGNLPLARWKSAWQTVLGRHAILRSGFMWEGLEKPVQVVARDAELPWHVEDLRGLSSDEQERRIGAHEAADRARGFALDAAPLIRCALFRLDEVRHRFLWTYHHLLLDGWCFSIVLREVLETVEKGAEALPPPARPYRDYITWLQEQDPDKAERFWRDTLRGFEQASPLPFIERRTPEAHPKTEIIRHLSPELTARLTAFAKAERLTLNSVMQGAWALVLGRTGDKDDVVFGVTISGRPSDLDGSESIVGLFINTVPLRARIDDRASVASFLAGIQEQQREVEAFGYASLADIQAWSDAPHDRPLFESLMVFENYPIDRSALLERSDLEISAITTHERTNYPLTVVAIPGDALEIRVMFDPAAVSEKSAERIFAMIESVLTAFTRAKAIGEIGLVDEATSSVLSEWGRNERPFALTRPAHALVAAQARRTPDAIAVVGPDGRRITYRELDSRAEAVAAELRRIRAQRRAADRSDSGPKDTIVGVAIGRSIDLVVALLGVLKAGAAYLPLDPAYPRDRLALVVEDASPSAILIAGEDPISDTRIPRLAVDRLRAQERTPERSADEPRDLEALAYLIYTSGSTGRPKGVLVSHRNLANLIAWHTEAFRLTAKDRTTQVASISFDAACWEIWPTLSAGASLYIVPPDLGAAPAELVRWITDNGITISFLSTPVAEAAIALPWPKSAALRYLLTGGDRLHAFAPPHLPFQLVNNYGPTETTVVATSGVVPASTGAEGLPAIGRPVANARIYILDRKKSPVPPGTVGELFIGGAGVARGYLNRPDLTEERFVRDPFSNVADARMYASGDLASFNLDGTIAFHGRRDRQVQVRGIRVEPGEIEAALAEHPSVSAAAIISEDDRQNGDVRLVAFAASRDTGVQPSELASYLAKKLPPAMLPARIVVVPELPLTPNGKIDHAALAARAKTDTVETSYLAPRTLHEEVLAGIWAAVLGCERVGVNDDFFAIGGHSLKATQVVARAREAFGVDIPIKLVFERRTIAAFAETLASGGGAFEPIPRADLTKDVAAAPGQERLWFIDTLTGPSPVYNVPLVLRMKGTLDVGVLRRALEILVDRHDSLRTTFHERAGGAVQRIGACPGEVLSIEDVSADRLDARVRAEVDAPFSLTTGPLFRARLFRLDPSDQVLVINQHHIIADAWSLAILLRELGQAYDALSHGKTPELPELPIRYADWAAWQHRRLAAGRREESIAFWKKALEGAPPCLTLPTDRPRPAEQTFRGKSKTFALEGPIGRRLESLARSSGASVFMTTLAAFAAYLARISGQDDLVIGVPAANRDRRETEGVVGFFLNTLALRIDVSNNPTFAELVQRVRKSALDAYAHQDVPFERIVAALEIPRDLAYNPLFQVMFTIQGESSDQMRLGDLAVEMPPFVSTTSKFDLTWVVEPKGEGLASTFEYSTDLFDDARIDSVAAQLARVLEAVAVHPDLPISEIPILSDRDRRQVLEWSRGPRGEYPTHAPIHALVAEHARKTPDALAIVGPDGKRFTYRELDQRADEIARELRASVTDGSKDMIVGVCIERSAEVIIAELAVLKAGAAYLPLDPAYPAERLAFITSDASPCAILNAGADPIADKRIPRIDVRRVGGRAGALPSVDTDALAYVIYTSGSTGTPKGVMIPHKNLVGSVLWHNDHFRVTSADRSTQLASIAFDATVWEIWPPLAAGAAVYVIPPDLVTAPLDLARWIVENGITICFLPTPLAEAALCEPWPKGGSLRFMHVAGDRLHMYAPPDLPFAMQNSYGPTEATVCAATGRVATSGEGLPSIGRPIGNTSIYILDPWQAPVPLGVVGEIYIGGAGIARGYLNRPDLTEERFLPDPFSDSTRPGARMYATGDLGSFNADGTISFHGRRDRQVKVRGVRIEPAEIETALASHPSVSGAAVVTKGEGADVQLVAFAAGAEGTLDPKELARFLSAKLPAAMVPGRIIALEALPLTPNGKVDHRALAARARHEAESTRVAPRTDREAALARIWAEVLERSDLGVEDDFFELGGHSLKATQLVSRMREVLGADVPVRAVFERRTIAELAQAIEGLGPSKEDTIPRLDPSRDAPLAPGQESLWFIEALGSESAAYNVPLVLELKGALDVAAFTRAIELLVVRHEALRTTFHEHDGAPVQTINPPPATVLSIEKATAATVRAKIAEEISTPFSLSKGPLFRARLFALSPAEHVLVINQHHIIIDAWSIGVLLRELCTAYAHLVKGGEPAFPELPIRYVDWAAWQKRRLEGDGLEASLDHWRRALAGAPEAIALPTDRARPERQSMRGKTKSFVLPAPIGAKLEQIAKGRGASLFMTMTAAFAAYLSRITGQDDIVIGSPAANRDRRETEGVVGFFLNTLALRIDLSKDPSFDELLDRVKSTTLDAFAHQDLPFEKLVALLGIPRSLAHNPLFQVMFALQGQSGGKIELLGVDAEIMGFDSPTSKFDLTLFAEPKDGGVACVLEYSTDLFDDDRIDRMAAQIARMCQAISAGPGRRIRELELLSEEDERAIAEFNRTERAYPERTLPELFERQLAKTPDAIALEHHGDARSYRALDAEAEALADRLAALGVGPGERVAFCLDRSIRAFVSMLATLKAGGAYVPLDPSYPKERLRYMLENAKARVLLTESKYADLISAGGAERIMLDREPAPPAPARKAAGRAPKPADLAYVLYTSGSTGKPKGVAMPHRALVNLIEWQTEQAPARSPWTARTLQFAPLSFDVSFQETFSTWCSGGTLVLVEEETRRDPDALVQRLESARIQRLFLPAVALHHLAQAGLRQNALVPSLEEVITAGDQLRITDPIRRWFKLGKKRLHNHYGPTESHVVTAHALEGDPDLWPGIPPIGRPIANSAVDVLDAHLRPVPLGVPGELYLSGACLADGYLHRPELTSERFVDLGGRRAYRTGDLGRITANGAIEFLGRADDQVKIRGFRVEPGEVERAICAHPEVRDAAVVVDAEPSREKRLVAYVVSEGIGSEELSRFIGADLPEYMVPSLFVAMPELPRTPSGKVDRRALPKAMPAPSVRASDEERTATEQIVARAFEEALGRERVGLDDDFFQLGGHSLLAMRVIARLRDEIDADIRVSELFENPTVARMSRAIDARQKGEARALARIERAPEGAPIPLSFSQERLWFLDQLHPNSPAYNLPIALRLRGKLDVGALEASLEAIIRRHPVLNVRFVEREGAVWQEPREEGSAAFELVELGPTTPDALRQRIAEEAARPFDLARGPLFRARLLRLAPEEHVVVSTMHHTVGDGWSISVLVRELSLLYAGALSKTPVELPELPIDYRDFAYQQRHHLQGAVLEARLDHWRKALGGAPAALDLPSDRPRPPKPTMRGATSRIALGQKLSRALEALSLRSGATTFMTLLAGFTAYLARITGEEDIVVGTPVANRDRRELERLIGFFVGTLPIRVDLSKDPAFEDLVERARASSLAAFAHQDVPLEKIVEAVEPERNMSHAPLFQVMLVLQNTPESRLGLPGLEVEAIDLEIGISKSDLALVLEPSADGLKGALEYSTDLFDPDRIERMVLGLTALLENAAAHPHKRVSELSIMPEAEEKAVLSFGHGKAHPADGALPIHRLVEAHARNTPDAIALELGGQTMSYAELNRRANRLAHHLIALGARPEKLVALCVPRSFEMIVALVAIWKAGAAYVPLDVAYPKARLDDIIQDCGAELIITTRSAERVWRAPDMVRAVRIDEPIPSADERDPEVAVRLDNVAYVIYTSGSTGRPKGVVLEHRGLSNVPEIHKRELGVDASCVVLQFASISFDASVWEIVMALASGGRLVLVSADTLLAGDELADVLIGSKVTHAALPPTSLLALPEDREYPALRHLITAGEACASELVKKWVGKEDPARSGFQFINGYGPTESTICTTLAILGPSDFASPPIGRPALNFEAHVLDPRGRPLPIGVPGELFIGGAGLARGYLNREELTREKFIPHPLRPTGRLYRSGDLVRWRKDGRLEYLGRIDGQVKLRGFRIELGEIESAIGAHPNVAQAVVNVHTAASTMLLVGYVMPEGDLDLDALRAHVKARLPEFMVPSEFVILDAIPLTPNGKVDKRRLPAPRLDHLGDGAAFVAPSTQAEQVLAEIWSRLLGRERIGVHDDFFALGGHSLLAAQVMSRVRKVFGVDVPLSAIFERPTLGALAAEIASRESGPALPPLVRREGGGDRPLSNAQERLRFLAELEGDSAAYNIPVALRLKGEVSKSAMEKTLVALVERHEVLSTHFPIVEGQPVARVGEAVLPLVFEDLSKAPRGALERRLAEESARPFSLATGPVVRAHLFALAKDEHVLLVVMHHIVSDGWSIGVMMRETSALYAAYARNKTPDLPPLAIQYADYAEWQRTWLDGRVRDRQLAHWKQALQGAPHVLDLPTDRPRPPVRSHRGGIERLDLSAGATAKLGALCREAGATIYMALLGAFAAYLGRISGQDDVVIGSPFAGRRIAETEPLIGFFVNTLPLRVDLGGDPTFLELLDRVRRQALLAHENQDVPFEKLVEELRIERVLGTSPIFQVMFALQQTSTSGMSLSGLQIEPVQADSGMAKFDLTLTLAESGDGGISGGIEYDLDLFDAWRVQAMVRHLVRFIEKVASEPGVRVLDVDFLAEDERARLMPKKPAPAPRMPSVHEAIAEQAQRTPDAIAVESDEGTLTYRALEERARRIAAELVRRGVEPDTLVAIAIERSLDLIAGILGILKAGAAYVPLDPAYPRDRLAFMVKDSAARAVVTKKHLAPLFPGAEVVALDGELLDGALEPRRSTLVYCLYTSGSTGTPKGVLIEHSALANHMAWMAEAMPLDARDRVLQRTSLSFDASVWEVFAPLMVGARLVLAPHDLGADTERLARILAERGITVLQLVPSLFTMLVDEPGLKRASSLRRVCAGGEPLPAATVKRCFEILGDDTEIWNLYGPTECTIDATAHRSKPSEVGLFGPTEPIGVAIARMEALVLDPRLRPVPDGVPGELYLAGACVGRGYWNRPELTEARFIEPRFPNGVSLRMYKTGDVVRRAPNGTLVFIGRADRQVKLRGFRIELGEVEAAIARHPKVRDVAALVLGSGGDARLAAFAVAREGAAFDPAEIRRFLEQQLAPHMVPGQIVLLDSLPHAPNGKVDYRALAAIEVAAPERSRRLEAAPRDSIELEIVRIFEEVLGMSDVGIHDNFFELGGHSLLALKVKLSVEKRLGRPLALVALFQNPTAAELAAKLRSGASSGTASPLVPLTPAARARLASPDPAAKKVPALFLVPGGGSTPFYLMSLARELEGVAVFGLQPRGLDGEAPPHETVEDTASWYASAILSVQPEGPYQLGGHSVGGHIAYEIAQQLKERGHEVGIVALLDTVAPFPEATKPMGQGWDMTQWMVQIAGVMEGFFNVKVGLDATALRAMSDQDRLEAVVARMQAAGILPAGAGPSHVLGILNVARAQDGTNYRPKRAHRLPLAVFRAEEKNDPSHPDVGRLIADDSLGWRLFTSNPVAAHQVPGTHLTLVREPNAAVLAKMLREHLER
jgi:amino acid adenylation domain-containing protein